MKKLSLLMFSAALLLAAPAYSNEMTGLDIMKLVDTRDDGDDLIQNMKQRLIDRRGNVREREMVSLRKDYGKDSKSITYFLAPSNIRDTGLLTWDYDGIEKDDDQWLYLPALKKVRRISSSDRGDYFMGTDFTFEDIKQTPELEDYNWTLIESKLIDGHDMWIVEGKPKTDELKKNLGYSNTRYTIRKDINMYVRVDYWDRKGKELKYLISEEIKQIDGVWTAMKGTMTNVQSNHRTELSFTDQRYNTGLSDRTFSERMLKRGYRAK